MLSSVVMRHHGHVSARKAMWDSDDAYGISEIPVKDRPGCAQADGHPLHRRQFRYPQKTGGEGLACGASALPSAFHPDLVGLAEPGGTLVRHGLAFPWMLVLLTPKHGPRILVPKRPGLQIMRGLFGITSSLFYFTGLTQLSLATAAAISFSSPLIAAGLSGPLLGEKVGLHRWAAIVARFLGTFIIVRPGGGASQVSSLLQVGGAVCPAIYQLLTRRLARSGSGGDDEHLVRAGRHMRGADHVTILLHPAGPLAPLGFVSVDGLYRRQRASSVDQRV